MSHRLALALSIALTLVLAGGVVAARDRLFAATTGVDQPVVDLADAVRPQAENTTSKTNAVPRVIEVTIPDAQAEPDSAVRDGSVRERRDDDEREHRGFDDDRYEHEDGDDDDD